jgi:hypothetical protein
VLTGYALGGWPGVVVGAAAVALVPGRGDDGGRRRRRVILAVGALLVVSSARWLLPQPDSTWSILPQALGLFLVCLLARDLGAPVGPAQGRLLDPAERGVGDRERDREGEGPGQPR